MSDISFQLETWDTFLRDSQELWKEHYQIIAQDKSMKMEPDIPSYDFLFKRGQLQILTAREAGRMIGYTFMVVRAHMHYASTLCGFEDAYYLELASRAKGRIGIKLIKETEKWLTLRGVKRVFWHTKVEEDLNLDKLFAHLGYSHSDNIHTKRLG